MWCDFLTGSGLVGEADVRTEGLPCKVISQSFSEIVCSTADLGFEFDTDFSVNFGCKHNYIVTVT